MVESNPSPIRRFAAYLPELGLVGGGIWLRVRMVQRFDPSLGYDAPDHTTYIEWFRTHFALPALSLCREAYHPPLYYWLAGRFSHGVHGNQRLFGVPSAVFAAATLPLIWLGLERWLPEKRFARLVALALAAVMPSAVHMSGMMSGEALSNFLAVVAMLLAAELLRGDRKPSAWLAPALGLILGLQLLTKISALVIVAAIALAALANLWWRREESSFVRLAIRRWAVVGLVFVASSGWYFARNQVVHGKAVLAGYDGVDKLPTNIAQTPYLDRRTVGYFTGWDREIFRTPFYPTATSPHPRFWTILVATSFADHYSYSFVRADPSSPIAFNARKLSQKSVTLARGSVMGGTLITAVTMGAWLWAAVACFRRKNALYLMLLLAPLLAVVGQLHFATKYSWDEFGPVKGTYLLFGCAPLFGLWGLTLSRFFASRRTLVFGALGAAATVAVAAYTLYASFA